MSDPQDKRIIFTRPDGGVSVIIPAPDVELARVMQDVPDDATDVAVVTVADIPQDRLFRGAWKAEGKKCVECPVKSKEIAHELRRAKRAAEFAPHDEVIAKQLPGKAKGAEDERQKIRDKDAKRQLAIDAAADTAELRKCLAE